MAEKQVSMEMGTAIEKLAEEFESHDFFRLIMEMLDRLPGISCLITLKVQRQGTF